MKVAVSAGGKEAVIAMLGPHDFCGEVSLVGQSQQDESCAELHTARSAAGKLSALDQELMSPVIGCRLPLSDFPLTTASAFAAN